MDHRPSDPDARSVAQFATREDSAEFTFAEFPMGQ